MSDETITIKLNYPFEYTDKTGTRTIDKLTFHPLSLGTLGKLNGDVSEAMKTGGGMLIIISDSAKVPKELVQKIDFRDMKEVMVGLTPFLGTSPKIGEN